MVHSCNPGLQHQGNMAATCHLPKPGVKSFKVVPPQLKNWFMSPSTIDISPINHSCWTCVRQHVSSFFFGFLWSSYDFLTVFLGFSYGLLVMGHHLVGISGRSSSGQSLSRLLLLLSASFSPRKNPMLITTAQWQWEMTCFCTGKPSKNGCYIMYTNIYKYII